MNTLYDLTQDYRNLLDLAGSADPEEIEVFNNTLEAVMGEIEVKADGYAAVMTEIKGRANTVCAEINRLKAIEDRLNFTLKRMEDRLKTAMEEIGTKDIKTDLHRFRIVGNGGKQKMVIDEKSVPDGYKVKVSVPDKEKIRKVLESGEDLSFAYLEDRGTHLKID
jgi:hypothetical protein